MPVMFSVVLPVLVSVVVWDGVPQLRPLQKKCRLVGTSSTTVLVPFSVTACRLPGALSAMDNVPVLGPLCVGLKVTLIVQVAPGARLEPQVCV